MARNTGPCHADLCSYESRFWPNVPMKWQVICSCGYIKSGYATEVAARLAANTHEDETRLPPPPEPVVSLDDYLARYDEVRAAQADAAADVREYGR